MHLKLELLNVTMKLRENWITTITKMFRGFTFTLCFINNPEQQSEGYHTLILSIEKDYFCFFAYI